MPKLNDRKIRWIIREIERFYRGVARIQDISRARVSQIYREYRETGRIPRLKKQGRPPKMISPEERKPVLEMYEKHRLGPVSLEKKIERMATHSTQQDTPYLLSEGMIVENPKKKKRRKYVRFEREHAMSMWQGEWKPVRLGDGSEKWMIAFMDDASRKIMCYGLYDRATTENTIKTLEEGFRVYGYPREILTDHGPQFTSNKKDRKGRFVHEFEEYLKEKGYVIYWREYIIHGRTARSRGFSERQSRNFTYSTKMWIDWLNGKKKST